MDDLPEEYYVETVEQLRSIADELRMRIGSLLLSGPMTATQVAKALGMAPSKIHYHLTELERVGLVKVAYTRQRGNLLERYYIPVARNIKVSQSLVSSSLDEAMNTAEAMVRQGAEDFIQAARRAMLLPEGSTITDISNMILWITPEQYLEVYKAVFALLRPYEVPQGIEGEREVALRLHVYEECLLNPATEPAKGETPAAKPSSHARSHLAGALYLTREDLEQAVGEGKRLDIAAVGLLAFDSAITPDLAEQALGSVRVSGTLRASPDVKAVIERKGGKPTAGQRA
jgi:DNA-binding transcriptional ArsR family regulator